MDFSNIFIERIVIHEIFRRDENRKIITPRYGDSLSELGEDGIDVLEERIINAIGKDSRCMEMEIEKIESTSCAAIVSNLLDLDDKAYIEKSKKIADKLADAQTSMKIPGGVVVVIQGTCGSEETKRFICIIKAEIHSGFTRNEEYILTYLSDLLLTPQQKLYKIAVFLEKDDNSNDKLDEKFNLVIYDQNMKKSDTNEAATYFYQTFLGSKFKRNSKIKTRDFYDFTKKHINSLNISDEDKFSLNMALYSYIKTPNESISVDEFATTYLNENLIDDYKIYMNNNNIPEICFKKNTAYIDSKLKQRRIKFTNEISVSGPANEFNEKIIIKESEDENITILEIRGKIREQQ